MTKFYIEGNLSPKNIPFVVEAIHSDDLKNRMGYNSAFLQTPVPLPVLAASLQNDIAVVQKDIGRNGDHVLDYTHFSVVHSKSKKLPFYAAVNIEGVSNLINMVHGPRKSDEWFADSRIFEGTNKFQFGNKEYAKSGFQKGHIVRYFDPAWGSTLLEKKKAMGDTFHFSNCCPQIPYYNSVVWNYLEDYYMARAIFLDKKITVFSGPVFNKARIIKGLLVPVNFWKVVVYKTPAGLSAMGFIMSQEKYFDKLKEENSIAGRQISPLSITQDSIAKLYSKREMIDAKVKISLIEEKTQISFGLNNIDEKRNDDRLNIELIKPPASFFQPQEAAAEKSAIPYSQQKELQAFFDAI